MTDFFISYTGADEAWAKWIAWQLEQAGYTTIIQAWDFRPGSSFVRKMHHATREAERTIAVLSPRYLAARYTHSEWEEAFRRDPTREEGRLLPVRIEACDVEGLFGPIIYIDLVGADEQQAKERLLEGVKQGAIRPAVAPPFPVPVDEHSQPAPPGFPGRLPAIWNVPHGRNPNFTGRDQLLIDLHAALAASGSSVITQAIIGLGGVGKTQLATEYAFRHAPDYDVVWWIAAEDPVTLASDYAALAAALDLPEGDTHEQVAAVRRWLQTHNRWLLIFDNARESANLNDYLPIGGQGSILITSRNPDWRAQGAVLSVRPWSSTESVQFLLKRTGQEDEAAAAELAARLGELPLALEQAAAYIAAHDTPLASYLTLFERHQLTLLGRSKPATDYRATVETTWSLALTEIEEQMPAAVDLLNLCAFLDPEGIPLDLLAGGGTELPDRLAACLADDLAREDAIGELLHYSLIERKGDIVSVHRLVQAVTRERLVDAGQQVWAEQAVRAVYRVFPNPAEDFRTWPVSDRLVPSARLAAEHAEHRQVGREWSGGVLNQVGIYLWARGLLTDARGVLERALAIFETVYGPEHLEVARTLGNLGIVLQDLGDPAGARKQQERALRIKEAIYGPEHPEVARTLGNLGNVLQLLDDLAGAREQQERALAIEEVVYGPEHPEVAITLGNLGNVLQLLGDLAGAREQQERALRIKEAVYGPEHPEVARTLTNLGNVLQLLGDPAGAREQLERALRIKEAVYGPEHPEVARTLGNLGIVLRRLGDLAGAREQQERALAIFRMRLGEDHPDTKRALRNLEVLAAIEREKSAGS